MQTEDANQLAEKIARILLSESRPTDISSLQKSVEEISKRLETVESKLEPSKSIQPASFIPNSLPIHASQERFNIAEAIADEVFARLTEEKACTFEPNDKPCDHCAMCSSRGF